MYLLRVYVGGKTGRNNAAFDYARAQLREDFAVVETLDSDEVKKFWWSPKDIVDWLLEADAHVILTHIHQGVVGKEFTECTRKWNAHDIEKELYRLRDHPGFPTGEAVRCSIFLQDKIQQVIKMADYMIPSIVVPLQERPYSDKLKTEIRAELQVLGEYYEGCGYHVKTSHALYIRSFLYTVHDE